jgi:hypothetical protein
MALVLWHPTWLPIGTSFTDPAFTWPKRLHPQAEHVIDWFHIAMRFTVLKQMARMGENHRHEAQTYQLRAVLRGIRHPSLYLSAKKHRRAFFEKSIDCLNMILCVMR